MSSETTTGTGLRGMGTHIPRLRTDLEQQRRFRVQQLLDLAIRASRTSMATPNAPPDDVLNTLRGAARTALNDIDAALRRIELGTYGRCQRCRTTIPLERLEVLPMVVLCMPCQYADEHDQMLT